MGKYKIENISGANYLVFQGKKGHQLSQREYYMINTGQISGLLKADAVKKGNSYKLQYNITGLISLKEYLYNPLNKANFSALLGNILSVLKTLNAAFFNQQYLLLDVNAVMVNPATRNVAFVFVPLTFFESDTNLKSFLLSIIDCASFMQGEDLSYIKEYIRILNSGINFSVFDLEEYIKNLNQVSEVKSVGNVCSRCNGQINGASNFCPYCGMKIGGVALKANENEGVYTPIIKQNQIESVPPETNFNRTFSVETAVINVAYLVRTKTGQRIDIPGTTFNIGKDVASNDYAITDNTAVSRNHATIKCINGAWFIEDKKSTNKTYVNNQIAMPATDIRLSNGSKIVLGNEEFTFHTNSIGG